MSGTAGNGGGGAMVEQNDICCVVEVGVARETVCLATAKLDANATNFAITTNV
jgi:hypothetical protein